MDVEEFNSQENASIATEALTMLSENGHLIQVRIPVQELRCMLIRSGWMHVAACLSVQDDLHTVWKDVETTLYPLTTRENDKFVYTMFVWQELPWVVVSFPAADRERVVAIFDKHGKKLGNGIPTIVGAATQAVQLFPLCDSSVFTLESKVPRGRSHSQVRKVPWQE